jgi:hypothetical protein
MYNLAVTAELATLPKANLLAPGSWRSAEDSAAVHKVGPPPTLRRNRTILIFGPTSEPHLSWREGNLVPSANPPRRGPAAPPTTP